MVFLYLTTCRIEHRGPLRDYLDRGNPFLLVWWHQDMLFNFSFLTSYASRQRIATMASHSADGALAAYLVQKHGMISVRGSSSRGGGEALHELMALLKKGDTIGVLVCDGPKPPARKAKFGIVTLARETGLPIVLVRSWAKHQYVFLKSWPKLTFVYPFSKVIMLSDGPIVVPSETKRDELEKYRLEVERRLNQLSNESERYFV